MNDILISKFTELYNNGLNDTEIAKELNVNHVTIHKLRRKFNLPCNFSYNSHQKFADEDLIKLYNQGLNWEQIARELNVKPCSISTRAKRLNLTSHHFDKDNIIPTEIEKQVIIGGLYGDSSLTKYSDTSNARLSFAHSLKQENYALYKYDILKRFCAPPKYDCNIDKRCNKERRRIFIYSHVYNFLTELYPFFYQNKIKYINPDVLYTLEPIGLSIWFMDDGYKCHDSYEFATNCFSYDDLLIVSDFFHNKYNIDISIHKNHSIRILKSSKEIFENIICPYIQQDCIYKIIDPCKTPLNGEPLIVDDAVLNYQEIGKMPND